LFWPWGLVIGSRTRADAGQVARQFPRVSGRDDAAWTTVTDLAAPALLVEQMADGVCNGFPPVFEWRNDGPWRTLSGLDQLLARHCRAPLSISPGGSCVWLLQKLGGGLVAADLEAD